MAYVAMRKHSSWAVNSQSNRPFFWHIPTPRAQQTRNWKPELAISLKASSEYPSAVGGCCSSYSSNSFRPPYSNSCYTVMINEIQYQNVMHNVQPKGYTLLAIEILFHLHVRVHLYKCQIYDTQMLLTDKMSYCPGRETPYWNPLIKNWSRWVPLERRFHMQCW